LTVVGRVTVKDVVLRELMVSAVPPKATVGAVPVVAGNPVPVTTMAVGTPPVEYVVLIVSNTGAAAMAVPANARHNAPIP
jgi:hypothetical protein